MRIDAQLLSGIGVLVAVSEVSSITHGLLRCLEYPLLV